MRPVSKMNIDERRQFADRIWSTVQDIQRRARTRLLTRDDIDVVLERRARSDREFVQVRGKPRARKPTEYTVVRIGIDGSLVVARHNFLPSLSHIDEFGPRMVEIEAISYPRGDT